MGVTKFSEKKFYIKLLENDNFIKKNDKVRYSVGYSTNNLKKLCIKRNLQTCTDNSSLIEFLALDDMAKSFKSSRPQLHGIILKHEYMEDYLKKED